MSELTPEFDPRIERKALLDENTLRQQRRLTALAIGDGIGGIELREAAERLEEE